MEAVNYSLYNSYIVVMGSIYYSLYNSDITVMSAINYSLIAFGPSPWKTIKLCQKSIAQGVGSMGNS